MGGSVRRGGECEESVRRGVECEEGRKCEKCEEGG